MAYQKTWAASHRTKAATGYRSKPEVILAQLLTEQGVEFLYEQIRIPYLSPATYIPDFPLPQQAILIEVKGAFDAADRTKLLRVKRDHPDLDIRLLFTNPNTRLSSKSKTTYGAWCDKHGFPFAKGPAAPSEWLVHVPSPVQREAFQRLLNGSQKED